jgi:predicted RNase H-like HicB family nuclease
LTFADDCRALAVTEDGGSMLTLEFEREEDGRWICEVPNLPGVMAYGATEAEARTNATALALRTIADRLEHGDPVPIDPRDFFIAA